MTMKRRNFVLTLAAMVAGISEGCGGSGTTGSQNRGQLTLTVLWPDRTTRLIPQFTQVIVVTLTDANGGVLGVRQILGGDGPPRSSTEVFTDLAPGVVTLSATAFPEVAGGNGAGVPLATGSTPATIRSGQTTRVTVTMGSTIATIEVSPANPTIGIGADARARLMATPRDAAGNVVLVPGSSFSWTSGSPAVAVPFPEGGQAIFAEGVSAGSALFTVTESDSGKSGTANITVTAAVNPLSSPRLMTVTPDGQFLYVVSANTRRVSQFRIGSDGRLSVLSPGNTDPLPGPLVLDIKAHPLSASPFVYVTNPDSDAVSQFRFDTGGTLSPLPPPTVSTTPGVQPAGIAIHPNGLFLYTADPVHSRPEPVHLSLYRIGADGTLSPLAADVTLTGFQVNRLMVTPNGQFLYTNNNPGPGRGEALQAFRVNADGTLAFLGQFGGFGLTALEFTIDRSGRFLYTVGSSGGSTSVQAFQIGADGSLTAVGASLSAGISPNSIAVTPDGKFVYAVDAADNVVLLYSVNADGSLARMTPGSIASGSTPVDLEVTPNGQFLYVSNSNSNTISQYRITANGTLTPL